MSDVYIQFQNENSCRPYTHHGETLQDAQALSQCVAFSTVWKGAEA